MKMSKLSVAGVIRMWQIKVFLIERIAIDIFWPFQREGDHRSKDSGGQCVYQILYSFGATF